MEAAPATLADTSSTPAPALSAPPAPTPIPPTVVVLATGDIGDCLTPADEETVALVRANPDVTVLALGDLAYPDGTAGDFERCYDPAWGDHRSRASCPRQPRVHDR